MYKKLNYAIGDVASTTAIDATTLTLKAGHTITTDIGETNKFVAVFYDGTKSSPYQDTNREIVEAYRTNTNNFTIARAKEGTSAKQWIENDKFMLIASAGVFNEYETEIASKQDALGYTAENAANKKTSLTDNSDTYYPTQKAVKTAVDAKLASASKASASDINTGTEDAKYVTPKGIADSDLTKKVGINSQADNYTLVIGDAGKLVIVTHANAKTLTVPKNSSVAFPTGTKIAVMQGGAGQITIAPVDGDVTLNSYDDALSLVGENAGCVLIKTSTDDWLVEGNLE